MVNLSTIKIFDKIYQLKYEENVSSSNFINETFNNSVNDYIEFVKDNKSLFSNNNLLITQTLSGYGIVSGTYPILNDIGLNKYYEYKKKQFIENEQITINYDFENISELMNISNTKALKYLLDYLIDSNLVIAKGDYAKESITGNMMFEFSMLKVKKDNINKSSEEVNINNYYNGPVNNYNMTNNGDKGKIKNSVVNKTDSSVNKSEIEKKNWFEVLLDKISKIFTKKN